MKRPGACSLLAVACVLAAATAVHAGASYEFDGNTAIDHGPGAALQLTDAVSVCAWVKSDLPAREQLIAGIASDPSFTGPRLSYGLRQSGGGVNRIAFVVSTGLFGSVTLAETAALANVLDWNWVCGAWDRGLDGGLLRIYLNGKEAPSYVTQGAQTAAIPPSGESFRVGGSPIGTEMWDGKLAYVQVWNRRITPAESREVMRRPGSRRKGLLLYSPMTTDIGFPRTPVLDDFNRPDGPIGNNNPSSTAWTHSWMPAAGSLSDPNDVTISIAANQARSTQGNANAGSEAWNSIFARNTEAYFTLAQVQGPQRCNGLYFRHPDVSNSQDDVYLCELCNHSPADSIRIWVESGGYTMKTDEPIGRDWLPGDVLGMRVVGSTIECYLNGNLVTSFVDSTHPGPGYMSLFLTDSDLVRGDDWGGGPYNGIRDLSGRGHHSTSGRVIPSADGPPVSGSAR